MPCEALFLRRCNDPAIYEQSCSAIVIKGRDAQYPHLGLQLENGVDEGRHRRSFRQYDKPAKDERHDDDWHHPHFLPGSHEFPKLLHEGHGKTLILLLHVGEWISFRVAMNPISRFFGNAF
jgi:hypothetical protein